MLAHNLIQEFIKNQDDSKNISYMNNRQKFGFVVTVAPKQALVNFRYEPLSSKEDLERLYEKATNIRSELYHDLHGIEYNDENYHLLLQQQNILRMRNKLGTYKKSLTGYAYVTKQNYTKKKYADENPTRGYITKLYSPELKKRVTKMFVIEGDGKGFEEDAFIMACQHVDNMSKIKPLKDRDYLNLMKQVDWSI